MKTMTCKQLGGACEKAFHAATFEEIAELSKQHGMEMRDDPVHAQAMDAMKERMQDPAAMHAWFEKKKEEFAALEDK